jgi:Glycine rich protein/F5/8 type C domain
MSGRRDEKSHFNDALIREQHRIRKEKDDMREKMLSLKLSQQQERYNSPQNPSQHSSYTHQNRKDFKEVSGLMGHRIDLEHGPAPKVDIRDINGQRINPNWRSSDVRSNNVRSKRETLKPYDPNESIIEGFEPTSRVLKQEDHLLTQNKYIDPLVLADDTTLEEKKSFQRYYESMKRDEKRLRDVAAVGNDPLKSNPYYDTTRDSGDILDDPFRKVDTTKDPYNTAFEGTRYNKVQRMPIHICSSDRDKTLYPDSNNMKIFLPRVFKDVKEIKLLSLEFPNTDQIVKDDPLSVKQSRFQRVRKCGELLNTANKHLYWVDQEDSEFNLNCLIYDACITPGNYVATKCQCDERTIQEEIQEQVSKVNIFQSGSPHQFIVTVDEQTNHVEIQSISSVPLEVNPITTEAGTNVIIVTQNNHGYVTEDEGVTSVTILGSTSVGGIPASAINKDHFIQKVIDDNSFEIRVTTIAGSTETGGGANVTSGTTRPIKLLFSNVDTIGSILGFPQQDSSECLATNIDFINPAPINLETGNTDVIPGTVPAWICSDDHDLAVGDEIFIMDTDTIPNINGLQVVTKVITYEGHDYFEIGTSAGNICVVNNQTVTPETNLGCIVRASDDTEELTKITFVETGNSGGFEVLETANVPNVSSIEVGCPIYIGNVIGGELLGGGSINGFHILTSKSGDNNTFTIEDKVLYEGNSLTTIPFVVKTESTELQPIKALVPQNNGRFIPPVIDDPCCAIVTSRLYTGDNVPNCVLFRNTNTFPNINAIVSLDVDTVFSSNAEITPIIDRRCTEFAQSFRPHMIPSDEDPDILIPDVCAINSKLIGIYIRVGNGGVGSQALIDIYDGPDTTGDILGSSPFTSIRNDATVGTYFCLPDIDIIPGNMYTWKMIFARTVTAFVIGNEGNLYTGGRADPDDPTFADFDYEFVTYTSPSLFEVDYYSETTGIFDLKTTPTFPGICQVKQVPDQSFLPSLDCKTKCLEDAIPESHGIFSLDAGSVSTGDNLYLRIVLEGVPSNLTTEPYIKPDITGILTIDQQRDFYFDTTTLIEESSYSTSVLNNNIVLVKTLDDSPTPIQNIYECSTGYLAKSRNTCAPERETCVICPDDLIIVRNSELINLSISPTPSPDITSPESFLFGCFEVRKVFSDKSEFYDDIFDLKLNNIDDSLNKVLPLTDPSTWTDYIPDFNLGDIARLDTSKGVTGINGIFNDGNASTSLSSSVLNVTTQHPHFLESGDAIYCLVPSVGNVLPDIWNCQYERPLVNPYREDSNPAAILSDISDTLQIVVVTGIYTFTLHNVLQTDSTEFSDLSFYYHKVCGSYFIPLTYFFANSYNGMIESDSHSVTTQGIHIGKVNAVYANYEGDIYDDSMNGFLSNDLMFIINEDFIGLPENIQPTFDIDYARDINGATATATSSAWWWAPPSKVIDGKLDTQTGPVNFWFGGIGVFNVEVTVDLNAVRLITQIDAFNMSNNRALQWGTQDYRIGISLDNITYTIVSSGKMIMNDVTSPHSVVFPPVNIRYIRFYADTFYDPGAGLAEIRAFGPDDFSNKIVTSDTTGSAGEFVFPINDDNDELIPDDIQIANQGTIISKDHGFQGGECLYFLNDTNINENGLNPLAEDFFTVSSTNITNDSFQLNVPITSIGSILGKSILSTNTITFSSAGSYLFVVPDGVYEYYITIAGGGGGNSFVSDKRGLGGAGMVVNTSLSVIPGEVIQINVGGEGGDSQEINPGSGGFNGGGDGGTFIPYLLSYFGSSAGGGGSSDIRKGSFSLAEREIVAGGGGGASQSTYIQSFSTYIPEVVDGGDAGAIVGNIGGSPPLLSIQFTGSGGEGGSQITGGASAPTGNPGGLGFGGSGKGRTLGGGGGGYYGGGSGKGTQTTTSVYSDLSGGGGGSCLASDDAIFELNNARGETRCKDGFVILQQRSTSISLTTPGMFTVTPPVNSTEVHIALGGGGGAGFHNNRGEADTGGISSIIMNVTANEGGGLFIGLYISGDGIEPGTFIAAFGTGFGGVGTYILNIPAIMQPNTRFITAAVPENTRPFLFQPGGKGGRIESTVILSGSENLEVVIGSRSTPFNFFGSISNNRSLAGHPGGGQVVPPNNSYRGSSGGGFSQVSINGTLTMIAGAGGGASDRNYGGNGGGFIGESGPGPNGGGGGTQESGGAGLLAGSSMQGGNVLIIGFGFARGCGGGGFFGGGAGGQIPSLGGGGGGSSYIIPPNNPNVTIKDGTTHTIAGEGGEQEGNGYAEITFNATVEQTLAVGHFVQVNCSDTSFNAIETIERRTNGLFCATNNTEFPVNLSSEEECSCNITYANTCIMITDGEYGDDDYSFLQDVIANANPFMTPAPEFSPTVFETNIIFTPDDISEVFLQNNKVDVISTSDSRFPGLHGLSYIVVRYNSTESLCNKNSTYEQDCVKIPIINITRDSNGSFSPVALGTVGGVPNTPLLARGDTIYMIADPNDITEPGVTGSHVIQYVDLDNDPPQFFELEDIVVTTAGNICVDGNIYYVKTPALTAVGEDPCKTINGITENDCPTIVTITDHGFGDPGDKINIIILDTDTDPSIDYANVGLIQCAVINDENKITLPETTIVGNVTTSLCNLDVMNNVNLLIDAQGSWSKERLSTNCGTPMFESDAMNDRTIVTTSKRRNVESRAIFPIISQTPLLGGAVSISVSLPIGETTVPFSNGQEVSISGVSGGNPYIDGVYKIFNVSGNTFRIPSDTLITSTSGSGGYVTGPAPITVDGHGLQTDDLVEFTNVISKPDINYDANFDSNKNGIRQSFKVTKINDTQFSIPIVLDTVNNKCPGRWCTNVINLNIPNHGIETDDVFFLYGAECLGGLQPNEINTHHGEKRQNVATTEEKYSRKIAKVIDDNNVQFTSNFYGSCRTANFPLERVLGGGFTVSVSSQNHGFNSTQTNMGCDGLLDHFLDLDPEPYVFLTSDRLSNILTTGPVENIFAKIQLSEPPGKILYDTHVATTKIFPDPISRLDEIDFQLKYRNGDPYDLRGKDYSMTIELMEYQDRHIHSGVQSRRGLSDRGQISQQGRVESTISSVNPMQNIVNPLALQRDTNLTQRINRPPKVNNDY